ncbi:MAG: NUDIX hydrolase [Natronincolaceae bacterium]|jgi:coenzyme A diphosphatase NUDT7|nr:CoA pyrophosphatase [Bacillota bacterium]NLK90243.1 CoA pyrophosphatase [Clostridiales bacterium]
MNISSIREAFRNKQFSNLDPIRESAVVVPIIKIDNKLHILFEIRALSLNNQPGEICFPGGKIEKNESALDCAIRETVEELNICRDNIEIIGKLACSVTPSNMTIYSFCGILNNVNFDSIKFNKHEVASIFTVPIDELLNQTPLLSDMAINLTPPQSFPFHLIQKEEAYSWKVGICPSYFYKYKDNIICGATAKILKNFLDTLEQTGLSSQEKAI